ncbi:HAD family hydrolase [Candidatus Woesearchaeota archaeon]|nr:HAD family hydrolase [Candidatus Woesearchaeota archaeon]
MPFPRFVMQFEDVFMRKSFPDLAAAFVAAFEAFRIPPKDWLIEKLIGIWNKNWLFAQPYPETVKVLDELRKAGFKLALVSNTCMNAVEPALEKFGLASKFDVVSLSYKTGLLKTDPEFFAEILKQLGVKKEEAVMVGDSFETDIEGATNAGIRAILVDRKNNREYAEKITSLLELSEKLK